MLMTRKSAHTTSATSARPPFIAIMTMCVSRGAGFAGQENDGPKQQYLENDGPKQQFRQWYQRKGYK